LILPHDKDSEKALLGSLLSVSSYLSQVKPWIPTDDVFYDERNQMVWNSILKLERDNKEIDLVTVSSVYPKKKKKGADMYYITGLLEATPSPSNAEAYAKIVHEQWLKRTLITQARRIQQLSSDNSKGAEVLLEEAHSTIGNLLNLRPGVSFDLDSLLEDTLDSFYNKKNLTPTGYDEIDRLITGMTRGEITIIAGRPANCKTTYAVNIARNLIKSGKKVMIVNREMPNIEMMKKIISMEAEGVSYRNLRHGIVDDVRMNVDIAISNISKNFKNLYMYDNIRDIPSTFREIKRIKPDVVIDDHVGLIEYPMSDKRDLRLKIGDTSRKYKWLAKAENMSVILVSQLNRNIEHRLDGIPRLSDLAESGFLEQDAEIVMFTHYPWITRYEDVDKHELNVYIVKNRYGETGMVKMGYVGDRCLIFDSISKARENDGSGSSII